MDNNRKAKICAICQCYPKREKCSTRKLAEYDQHSQTAIVYHIGQHRCHEKLDLHLQSRNLQARTKKYAETGATANQAGKLAIRNLIIQGKAKEAKEEMKYWIDKRMAQRVINEQQPTHSKDENSFDAVGIVKRTLNEVNKFYIHRINNGSLNGKSDCVFKNSCEMTELAIHMDVNGPEDGLQKENAFFDVTQTGLHGFKSFALWLVHGLMWEMICLASMEMCSENSNDIAIFLDFLTKCWKKFQEYQITNLSPGVFSAMKDEQIIRLSRWSLGKNFVMNTLEAVSSTLNSKSRRRIMRCQRNIEMNLSKYVMNYALLQLSQGMKYSKASLNRWHVLHHLYGHGSTDGT